MAGEGGQVRGRNSRMFRQWHFPIAPGGGAPDEPAPPTGAGYIVVGDPDGNDRWE